VRRTFNVVADQSATEGHIIHQSYFWIAKDPILDSEFTKSQRPNRKEEPQSSWCVVTTADPTMSGLASCGRTLGSEGIGSGGITYPRVIPV
jgi:hypothetical protein